MVAMTNQDLKKTYLDYVLFIYLDILLRAYLDL